MLLASGRLKQRAFYVKSALPDEAGKFGHTIDKFGGAFIGWRDDVLKAWAVAKSLVGSK